MLDQEEKKGEEQELQPQADQGAEKANETGGGIEAPGQQQGPEADFKNENPTIEMTGLKPDGKYPTDATQYLEFSGQSGSATPKEVRMALRNTEGKVVWSGVVPARSNPYTPGTWKAGSFFTSYGGAGKFQFEYCAVSDMGTSEVVSIPVEFVDMKKHESDGGGGPTAGDSSAGSAEN
jgi:hypothetical protein